MYASWKNHYRGGGVCTEVDGVEDNGTTRDELVEAEIEGTVRFGGLGEFFTPWDLTATARAINISCKSIKKVKRRKVG